MAQCIDASAEIRAANRLEFDLICDKLRKQLEILERIKSEVLNLKDKAISLRTFIQSYNRMEEQHKTLYNMYLATFLATVDIYLGVVDSQGNKYINPVTETEKTTDMNITIKTPHHTLTRLIMTLDNLHVDTIEHDIKIGNNTINFITAEDMATQFSSIEEEPTPYYSPDEMFAGILNEAEKLMIFYSEICKNALIINAGIRYIGELKSLGIY